MGRTVHSITSVTGSDSVLATPETEVATRALVQLPSYSLACFRTAHSFGVDFGCCVLDDVVRSKAISLRSLTAAQRRTRSIIRSVAECGAVGVCVVQSWRLTAAQRRETRCTRLRALEGTGRVCAAAACGVVIDAPTRLSRLLASCD